MAYITNDEYNNAVTNARRRYLEGRIGAAGSSNWEQNNVKESLRLMDERKAGGLLQHERDMQADRLRSDELVAFEKRMGQENQFAKQAQENRALGEYEARLRHGFTDDNGTFHPGNVERTAEIQGKYGLSQADRQAQSAIERQKLENQGKVDTANATGEWGVKAEQERSKQAAANAEAQRLQNEMKLQNDLQKTIVTSGAKISVAQYNQRAKEFQSMTNNGMTAADAMKIMDEKYKDDPIQNEFKTVMSATNGQPAQQPQQNQQPQRKQFSQGWATLVDGKWVLDGK